MRNGNTDTAGRRGGDGRVGRPETAGRAEAPPFEGHGVIVDINSFFTAASESGAPAELQAEHEVGGRALVTEEGVYAFLETPEKAGALEMTEPGSVVQVSGKLLERGALVHVDSLKSVTTVPADRLRRLSQRPPGSRSPSPG